MSNGPPPTMFITPQQTLLQIAAGGNATYVIEFPDDGEVVDIRAGTREADGERDVDIRIQIQGAEDIVTNSQGGGAIPMKLLCGPSTVHFTPAEFRRRVGRGERWLVTFTSVASVAARTPTFSLGFRKNR